MSLSRVLYVSLQSLQKFFFDKVTVKSLSLFNFNLFITITIVILMHLATKEVYIKIRFNILSPRYNFKHIT